MTLFDLDWINPRGDCYICDNCRHILWFYIFLSCHANFWFIQIFRGDLIAGEYSGIPAVEPLSLFLILHAFSTGCTALTGIEAISNGVPAFRPPEAKNAGKTLIIDVPIHLKH